MKQSRVRPRWAKKGLQFVGLVAACFLLYWVLAYTFDSSQRDDEAVRRQFYPTGRTISTGHSPFALPASLRTTPVGRQIENFEPGHAGWDSEVVSAAISKQLDRLSRKIESDNNSAKGRRAESDFSEITAERFEGVILPQDALRTVFDDGKYVAQRLPGEYADFLPTDSLHVQVNSLLGTG